MVPLLEARHLSKRFFGISAVHDVSFALQPGQVVGYLGPNGSGKTTTIQMLTGQLEPSAGQACFLGRDIEADPLAFRRRLGYVPEEPHLYPFLRGREYLQFVGRLRELPETLLDRKIRALLELFDLEAAADQDVGSYSKGMRQKVLLGAALLHNPDVLILDEPESGLDVTTALVLRHLVRTLAARGKAILYTSHVLEVVQKVCTHVIVLHRGRVVADDYQLHLRELSHLATLFTVLTVVLGAGAYGWNARRFPQPAGRPRARRPVRGWVRQAALGALATTPVARAGFAFTLRALVRSAPHAWRCPSLPPWPLPSLWRRSAERVFRLRQTPPRLRYQSGHCRRSC